MSVNCNADLMRSSEIGRTACYIKRNNRTIFSVSPERLIHINGQDLTTSPIKGTAPRSNNLSIDRQNAADLTASIKNQAENLMIVDLLRNDLSIHALPHSVKVEKLYELESHHNVHHLVSTISAKLKPYLPHSDYLVDFECMELCCEVMWRGNVAGCLKRHSVNPAALPIRVYLRFAEPY